MNSFRKIKTGSKLNPISISPEFGKAERNVLFYGGWEQNPVLLEALQLQLLEAGIASAGFNAFEVIKPLEKDDETPEVMELRESDTESLLDGVSGRMIQRAVHLIGLTNMIMDCAIEQPTKIHSAVTHCAGANVFLLARYIESLRLDRMPTLNDKALLLEPMIARGQSVRTLARQNAEHEKKTINPAYISLLKMRHPKAVNLGMQASIPVRDILESRGMDFLFWNGANGANMHVVLGREDVASPESIADEIMEAHSSVQVSHYPMTSDSARYGHGYVFAEQEKAASYIASRLS